MCKFKSAMCLKDRVFVPDYNSHDEMLRELGIEDTYANASKRFIRVELSPTDGKVDSDPATWKLNVDQDILPDWFDREADEPRVRQAITAWCAVHVIKEGKRRVTDGVWYACGSASVTACGSASVTACGSASVTAYDSASVTAYDSASVKACGSATVILPKIFKTKKPVQLSGEAICIDHGTHTIQTPIRWVQEAGNDASDD